MACSTVAGKQRTTRLTIEGARVAAQGFGNVGGTAGKLFATGARLVAVQDHTGTIVCEGGMDAVALQLHVKNTGGVAAFPAPRSWPATTSGRALRS